ncbi:hypothetical protein R1flu_020479 [Riccia fluitans]|uniref:Uncharacterized protein n=1 Tax=Riccia fluitans TaxID=41844 RepID=A0ABD1ZLM1_9MARC
MSSSRKNVFHREIRRLQSAVEDVEDRLTSLEESDHGELAQVLRRLEKLEMDTASYHQQTSHSPNYPVAKCTEVMRTSRKSKDLAKHVEEAADDKSLDLAEEKTQDDIDHCRALDRGALSMDFAVIVGKLLRRVETLEMGIKVQNEELLSLRQDVGKLKGEEFELPMKPPPDPTTTLTRASRKKQQPAAALYVGDNTLGITNSSGGGLTIPLDSPMYTGGAERCATSTKCSQNARLGHDLPLSNARKESDSGITADIIHHMDIDTVAEEKVAPAMEKTHGKKGLKGKERKMRHPDGRLTTRQAVKSELQVRKVRRKSELSRTHTVYTLRVRGEKQIPGAAPKAPTRNLRDHCSWKVGREVEIARTPLWMDLAVYSADHSAESKDGSSLQAPEEFSSSVAGRERTGTQDMSAAVDSGNVLSTGLQLDLDEDPAMTRKVLKAYEI